MTRLKISMGLPRYERTDGLMTGEVVPEGIDLIYVTPPRVGGVVHGRMLKYHEYDASEMSMSHFMRAKLAGKANFTAIPVFPMRVFFHTRIWVNNRSGIKVPADLKGKRFGVAEYGMSMALWLRGALQHEFGVNPSDIEWVEQRTRATKVGDTAFTKYPEGVAISEVPQNTTLVNMFLNGEVDAMLLFLGPGRDILREVREAEVGQSRPRVRPLFDDPKAEAIRYFKKTGLFPINHMVVVKDEILEENPWVALSLYDAFQKAKQLSYRKSAEEAEDISNFIWLDVLQKEVKDVFGDDPFPYGIKANEKTINTMASYVYEQGFTPHQATIAELFAYNTLNL